MERPNGIRPDEHSQLALIHAQLFTVRVSRLQCQGAQPQCQDIAKRFPIRRNGIHDFRIRYRFPAPGTCHIDNKPGCISGLFLSECMDLSYRFFLPCIRSRPLLLESAYIIGSFHLLREKRKPVCRPERLIAHLQQVLFQILPACTASIDIRPQASHFPDRSRRRLLFQRRRIMISDHQAESGVRKDQPKGRPFTKCLPCHRHGRQ